MNQIYKYILLYSYNIFCYIRTNPKKEEDVLRYSQYEREEGAGALLLFASVQIVARKSVDFPRNRKVFSRKER